MRSLLSILFVILFASCFSQVSQAPLQSLYSAGGVTGATYPSSSVPTYFASVGQPVVYARTGNASNGAGVMNANEVMFSDQTLPVVIDNTLHTVSAASNITVTANITDSESSVTAASVSYRSIDAGGALTTKNLSPSGTTYTFQITTSEIGELGIEYKISATSGGGTFTDTNFKTVKVNVTGSGLPVPYSSFGSDVSNYRIVAVPLTLGSNTVNDVFGDDLGAYGDKTKWRMYRYDNGATSELSGTTAIDPGKGYWLIAKSTATINTGAGSSVQTSSDTPFQIDLKADWNEIGNPYNFNLSWTDVQAANPNLPGLRIYDGDFADGTRLKAFEGGFVKVNATQKLVFPVLKNASVQGGRRGAENVLVTNSIDQRNWRVYFNLTQGLLQNQISGLGMDEKAAEGFDALDGFNLPRFFEKYLNLNHNKKEGQDFYSRDIVPPSDNRAWEFNVESSSDDPILLGWDNSYFGARDKQLYLWDITRQRAIDMKMLNTYEFRKTQGNSFKVFYGSNEFVREQTKVDKLVLHAVWPNPANDDVNISFSLPETSGPTKVNVSLTDLLGKIAWTQDSNFIDGYHETKWRRSDTDAPGVYFITVSDGLTKIQRKLVLK